MAYIEAAHVGDIGTVLLATISDTDSSGGTSAEDVSSATTMQIKLRKPSGTVLTKTASFYTDGTDGKIKYVTESGDLDEVGVWYIQALVVVSDGTFSTNSVSFKVHENLQTGCL